MDLNKFVFIPSKPKSLKLNGRNLRELRMETVQLAEENMEMEGRLKQLREDMGRQKEERARYGGLWWKSGQAGALTSPPQNGKRNGTGKLSGGKVKIRVLKDEPPGVRSPARGHGAETQKPVDSGPGPQAGDQSSNRTPRLKGKVCGQCEAKTAGLVCAECGEDYCIGCFTKFHQKGALKLHRMIPVQMEIQTSVSTLDVVRHFQSQPGLEMSTRPQTRGLQTGQASWTGGLDKGHHMAQTKRHDTQPRSDRCSELPQVLVVNHEEEAAAAAGGEEAGEEEFENLPVGWGHSTVAPLLRGCFDEEESAQSFQQALQEWRGTVREHRQQPVSVEALGIQADFDQNKPLPTRIEFRQHSLSYMEKLLIKKHRRTPVEGYRPLSSSSSTQAQDPLSLSNTEADEKFCLTAEEQELHRYCVSLFAVPVHKASDELGYPSESSFCIADLGKTAGDMGSTATAGATEEENKKLNEDKENHHDTKTRRSISAHSLCLPLGIKEGSASLDASSSFPSDQHTPTRSQTAGRNLVPSTRATSLTLQPLRLGFSSVGSVQSPSPPPQSQKPTLSPRLTAAIGFKTLKAKAVAPLAPELSSAARLKGSPVLFPPSGFTPAPPEHQSSNSIQAPRLPMPSSPRPIQTSSSSNYQSNKLRNQHHISNPLGHLNRRRPSRPESADSPNSVQPQAPSLTELFQSFNCNISRSEVTPSSTSSSDMLMSAMGIDSEGEGLSDSISPLPNQGNSSDEEMRGSPVSSTGPSGLDISAEEVRNPRSSSCSDLKPLDTGLFTQPSPALQAVARRQPDPAGCYLGLDGFLTLGLNPVFVQHTPGPTGEAQKVEIHPRALSRVQLSWRPNNSLADCEDKQRNAGVMDCLSPQAEPFRRTVSATLRRPLSGASARPTSCPVIRPLSRAVQEITDIQSAERSALDDSAREEEESEDSRALASLEEELRGLSAEPDRQELHSGMGGTAMPLSEVGPPGHGPGRGAGSARRRASTGQPDEEEEYLRDKQNVLSLP